jgi:hypothetical protein
VLTTKPRQMLTLPLGGLLTLFDRGTVVPSGYTDDYSSLLHTSLS